MKTKKITILPPDRRFVTDEWLAKLGFKTGDVVDAEPDPRQDEVDDRTGRPTARARHFMGAMRFKSPVTGEDVVLFRQEFEVTSVR